MNFNLLVTNAKNLFPSSFPEGLKKQPAKMLYAARYLLDTGRTGIQVLYGSIKYRVNQGSFSLDPAFREQMAGQFAQAKTYAAQAGVAGFLGLFAATAVAVIVIAQKISKKEENPLTPPASSSMPLLSKEVEAVEVVQITSKSHLIEDDHTQAVKAPTSKGDPGSKDCVNVSSSTAVSKFSVEAYLAWLTTKGQKAKDSPFKLLCQDNPAAAMVFLSNEKRPGAKLANQVLQDILDGIFMDMVNKKDQEKSEELNKNRIELLNAYFLYYPVTDPKFLGQQLEKLSFEQKGSKEQDRLPFFITILNHVPPIKNYLIDAFYQSTYWDYRLFLTEIFARAPSLKLELTHYLKEIHRRNLKLLEWIFTEHRDSLSESDISGVLTLLILNARGDKARYQLFLKIIGQNPDLTEPKALPVLEYAVDVQSWEMFKIAGASFKNLTRDGVEKVIAAKKAKIPEEMHTDFAAWIDERFQNKE